VIKKTVSIGGAIYKTDSDNIEKVINLADEMLYKAKESGRNRVVIYGAPTSQ